MCSKLTGFIEFRDQKSHILCHPTKIKPEKYTIMHVTNIISAFSYYYFFISILQNSKERNTFLANTKDTRRWIIVNLWSVLLPVLQEILFCVYFSLKRHFNNSEIFSTSSYSFLASFNDHWDGTECSIVYSLTRIRCISKEGHVLKWKKGSLINRRENVSKCLKNEGSWFCTLSI